MGERAERFRVRYPIKYRIAGEERWSVGETVNVSRSGLLFTTARSLPVGSSIELVILLDDSHGHRRPGLGVVCSGSIVRTSLASWPEIGPTAAVVFQEFQLGFAAD